MEVNSGKSRLFRSKSVILELLHEQLQSGLSIQAFCTQHSIASGSFHNWKKNYGASDGLSTSFCFAPVQISASVALFAEVSGIKLYKPVSAGYLKELAS